MRIAGCTAGLGVQHLHTEKKLHTRICQRSRHVRLGDPSTLRFQGASSCLPIPKTSPSAKSLSFPLQVLREVGPTGLSVPKTR